MIKIRPIKEWEYKSPDRAFPSGTICMYCGGLLCGYAEPDRLNGDQFRFHSRYDIIDLPARIDFTLDEIKDHIYCSLKEFIKKVAYAEQPIKIPEK